MSIHVLYKAMRGWDGANFPPELAGWAPRQTNPDGFSEFNTAHQYSTLHADVSNAILDYAKKSAAKMCLINVASGVHSAERSFDDGTTMVVSVAKNGKLRAAMVTSTGRYTGLPGLGDKGLDFDASPIFLALLPVLCEASNQAKEALEDLCLHYDSTGEWKALLVYLLCDAMYYALTTGKIKCNIPQGNVDLLSEQSVNSGAHSGDVICGSPKLIMGLNANAKTKNKKLTIKEARVEFLCWAQNHQDWSPEEAALIPDFPDDYPVPDEALKIVRRYLKTRKDTRPMCNFMWRGITSYGKSTGVEIMAHLLNMPLVRMTCHSTMETQAFLSDFVPDNGAPSIAVKDLPDFDEIAFDPENAYFKLTGIEDDNATPDMCLAAYGKATSSTGEARFKHVESNFVKGLERGYIVEVQELSRIKDSGVLVGLNEYDRPGAIIPLVDGSTAQRHPDAMVVYTDNVGYSSCRPVDPSVIRRMAFILDSYELSKEDVIRRVLYNTQFADQKLLKETMYPVWEKISEFCKEHEITEGTVSVTELEMWVQSFQADGMRNLRENCIECVVAKATSDISEQQEIIGTVLAIHLNDDDI